MSRIANVFLKLYTSYLTYLTYTMRSEKLSTIPNRKISRPCDHTVTNVFVISICYCQQLRYHL